MKSLKPILAVLLVVPFFLSTTLVFGSSVMWSQTFGGTEFDVVRSVLSTPDGGYAIVGYTHSFGAGQSDIWLVRTDPNGNMEWNQTYGGIGEETFFSIVLTSDGGYAIAGDSSSFGESSLGCWLVKTDTNGNVEWNRTYLGYRDTHSLAEASDGGYVIAGRSYENDLLGTDIWLLKTDELGNVEYKHEYGDKGISEDVNSLIATSDGGYALVGTKTDAGITDFWLVKINADGNIKWNQTYGGAFYDWAYSLVETSDRGYALAGATIEYSSEEADILLVKTDSSGKFQWNQTYGGIEEDWAYSLILTPDGGYAIGGYTWSFGAGKNDVWVIKTDNFGNMEWNHTYGGADYDNAQALVMSSDGGYTIAGSTQSFGAGLYDFWLVKTDELGNIPEFPSWLIPPLFMTATFIVIITKNKLLKKKLI